MGGWGFENPNFKSVGDYWTIPNLVLKGLFLMSCAFQLFWNQEGLGILEGKGHKVSIMNTHKGIDGILFD